MIGRRNEKKKNEKEKQNQKYQHENTILFVENTRGMPIENTSLSILAPGWAHFNSSDLFHSSAHDIQMQIQMLHIELNRLLKIKNESEKERRR